MAAVSPCPGVEVLRRFGLGKLTESEIAGVQQHLAGCACCLETMDGLREEDALVRAVGPWAVGEADEGEVGDLIARLRDAVPAMMDTGSPDAVLDTPGGDVAGPGGGYPFLEAPQGPDEIGRLGTYRVLRELGAGGMGVVFEAEDQHLQRRVALKVINTRLAGSAAARQGFLREARAVAALDHEHVVTVHQAGEAGGVVFLVMQLLKGETLEDCLSREGRLPAAAVVRIGRGVAEALAAAHAVGLAHGDIKPANLWLEAPRGRVKVLDFGVVQALKSEAADLPRRTDRRVVTGTPAYMAPEQARGEAVDARADLFSLGCVLYRMSTGVVPFPGVSRQEVLRALERGQPEPPRKYNPALPRPLADLILRLLAKDPQDRPHSAQAVAEVLTALQQHLAHKGRRAFFRWLALGAGAVAVIAGGLALLHRHQPGPPPGGLVGEVQRFDGYIHEVFSLAFSPDGHRALAGPGLPVGGRDVGPAPEHDVRLYDLVGGRELRRLRGQTSAVLAVAFAPDGRRGLTCDCTTFRVWDLETGERLRQFGTATAGFHSVAFSPDGSAALTGGEDHVLRLWDVASGQEAGSLEGHREFIWDVKFSPDGRRGLSGGGGRWTDVGYLPGSDHDIRLWDLDCRRELRRFRVPSSVVDRVAFSPDGGRAASGGWDGLARLWDVERGKEVGCFEAHSGTVTALTFTPNGRLLSGGSAGSLRLWDGATGTELRRWSAHPGGVRSLAVSPDGRQALSGGASDGTVRLWRLPP
jgi:hypothetical protein